MPPRARARAAARRGGGTRSKSPGVDLGQLEGPITAVSTLHEQRAGSGARNRFWIAVLRNLQGAHGVSLLLLELERLAAGRQHAHARTAGQEITDERSGGEQMLEVVEHQDAALGARKRWAAAIADPPRTGVTLSAWTIALGTCSPWAVAASETSQAPSGYWGSSCRATSSASRVLPTPPGPVSVTSRWVLRWRSSATVRRSSCAPDGVCWGGGSRLTQGSGAAGARSPGSWVRIELLQLTQRGCWFEAELFVEDHPRLAVGLERLSLTAAAVQGQHQLATHPFAERMLGHERLELADKRRVRSAGQVRVDAVLEQRQPQLLEPADLAPARTNRRRTRRAAARATGREPPAGARRPVRGVGWPEPRDPRWARRSHRSRSSSPGSTWSR